MKGIYFNAENLQLKCDEASFFGHTLTPEETRKCFLGLMNCLTRYSSQSTTIIATLRELTEKGITFLCGPEHDHAFRAVKQEISSMSVLRYFDPRADTTI